MSWDKGLLNKYNLAFSFDENLREVFDQPNDARDACTQLEVELARENEPEVRLAVVTQLGNLQRILGNLTEAEKSFAESLRLLAQVYASRPQIVAAQIRLAHVFQWQSRFAEADRLFTDCLNETRTFDDRRLLESFGLQHYGKSLFDQKKFDLASRQFEEALKIRIALKRDDLAESSRLALNRTREMLSL